MASIRRRIYLDHNATAPLLDEARDALTAALDLAGNPSSVHAEGRRARAVIEDARRNVAALVRGAREQVVFTSGATEAAATCLTPDWVHDGRAISLGALAVIDTDHPATRDGGRFPAHGVTRLAVDADGILDVAALDGWLDGLPAGPAMLALCLANGETGVVQPLDAIQERLVGRDVLLVVDAVQAAGRLRLDVAALGADAVILSGHKIGAAKGVGALVLASERLRPFRLVPGGGQERGLRSGTEAVPAIASFGAAARIASLRVESGAQGLSALRDRIVERLRVENCVFRVLGRAAGRIDNTLALAIPGFKAETVQIALDLEGFAVSAGSACSSGKVGPSHVLAAMAAGGLDVDPALGLLRVSLGHQTSQDEVEAFAAVLARIVRRVRNAKENRRAA